MAYDEVGIPYSPLWVGLWLFNCIVLFGMAFITTPADWGALFIGLFLIPEMVGLWRHKDALPPLTYVVRRYLPQWMPTAMTWAFGAFLAASWLPTYDHKVPIAVAIAGMCGWLTEHWAVTYAE